MKRPKTITTGVSLLSACLTAAEAQESTATSAASADSAAVVYEADFFTSFNAQTAYDMVIRVPGFTFNPGENVRGLAGSFGNVLINGERPAAKGDGLINQLRNVSAASVLRLELIRGSDARIDMRGQNLVVNVVLSSQTTRSGAYSASLIHWDGGRITPAANASMNFQIAGTEVRLGVELDGHARRYIDLDRDSDAGGTLLRTRHEDRQQDYRYLRPSLALERQLTNGDSFRLNGNVFDWTFRSNEWLTGITANTPPPDRYRLTQVEDDGHILTLGGDYEHVFDTALRGKLIGYYEAFDFDSRGTFADFDAMGRRTDTLTRYIEQSIEAIARSTLTWSPAGPHVFEASGELAYNMLDGDFRLAIDDGSGPVNIPIFLSDTKVEELRFEAGLNHVWQTRPGLTVESELLVELSTITQTGEIDEERGFTYAKPSITATWDVTTRDQLRFGIERTVGQLDFGDFVSNVEVNEDQTNIGNPELVPDQSWLLSAAWERRLGERGSVSTSLTHAVIQDVIGLVPVTGASGRFDAPGNLGDGQRTQIDVTATLPLDTIGISGAILEPLMMIRRTEVTDPLTFETRSIDGFQDWRFGLDFRQNLPSLQMAWGANYFVQGTAEFWRLAEYSKSGRARGDLEVFIETTRWFGLTTRIGGDMLIDSTSRQSRHRYATTRDAGLISSIERAERTPGPQFYITVSGSF